MASFSSTQFTASYPDTWEAREQTTEFPEGTFPQIRFLGPEEPYEIGVTDEGVGPSFVSRPEVNIVFGPKLAGPLKEFTDATIRELKKAKPSKPKPVKIAGLPAFEIFCEFRFPEPGTPTPVHLGRQILHVDNHGQLVVISYTAHATQLLRFKKEAESIIASLRFHKA